MDSGIYKITNTINNKCYIGLSKNLEKRIKQHEKNSLSLSQQSMKKLYWAVSEYGRDNFKIEILEKCLPENLAKRENYWIKEFNSYEDGYNSSWGGEGADNSNIQNKYGLSEIYSILDKCSYKSIFSYQNNIRSENSEISQQMKRKSNKRDFCDQKINYFTSKYNVKIRKAQIKNKIKKVSKFELKTKKKESKFNNKYNETERSANSRIKTANSKIKMNESRIEDATKENESIERKYIKIKNYITKEISDLKFKPNNIKSIISGESKSFSTFNRQKDNVKYRVIELNSCVVDLIFKRESLQFKPNGKSAIKINHRDIKNINLWILNKYSYIFINISSFEQMYEGYKDGDWYYANGFKKPNDNSFWIKFSNDSIRDVILTIRYHLKH